MEPKPTPPKSCTTCIKFHAGLRVHYPDAEKLKIIGECDSVLVPTHMVPSYGMPCNGVLHQPKP